MENLTKFRIFLIEIIGLSAKAQEVRYEGLDKDYTQSMDSLLTYVDKSRINTGILYDRVFTFNHYKSIHHEKTTITLDCAVVLFGIQPKRNQSGMGNTGQYCF